MKLKNWICGLLALGLVLPSSAQNATAGVTRFAHVNRDKEAVRRLYTTNYVPARDTPTSWKDLGNCNPGSLSPATLKARLTELNYFRKMAGLHAVTLDPESNKKAQAAAYLMLQNNALSHSPPTNWKCYTELAAVGAGSCNLGYGGGVFTYIEDFGDNNRDCGHRMWILKSKTETLGYGATNGTSAVHVFGPTTTYDSLPQYVAWPPAGFIPTEILTYRWTFAVPGESASFAKATVQLTLDGVTIPLAYCKPTDYGDGGIAFELEDWAAWSQKIVDNKVNVSIKNVKVGDEMRSYAYQVAPFNAVESTPYVYNDRDDVPTTATTETEVADETEVAEVRFAERKLMALGELVEPSELPAITVEQLRANAVKDLVFNAAFSKFATQVSNFRKAKNPDPTQLNAWAAAKIKGYLARQSGLDEPEMQAAQTPKFLVLEIRKMIPVNGQETFGEIATEFADKFAENPELKTFTLKYKRVRQCGMGLAVKRIDRNGQTYAGVYATLVIAPTKLVMGS